MPGCSTIAGVAEAAGAVGDAVAALRRGGVVVYPTETFYGLGVDAFDERALGRLVQLKGRPQGKPVAVLVSDRAMVRAVASSVPPLARRLMERFWPGPVTLVVPARPDVSDILTGGTGTIGVRWSANPLATGLVAALGRPLTTPSANPNAAAPPVDVAHARAYFGAAVDVYLDGGTLPGGLGSTVVEVVTVLRIVREGTMPAAAIAAVCDEET